MVPELLHAKCVQVETIKELRVRQQRVNAKEKVTLYGETLLKGEVMQTELL